MVFYLLAPKHLGGGERHILGEKGKKGLICITFVVELWIIKPPKLEKIQDFYGLKKTRSIKLL